jgi:hypothetical protein
MRADAHGPAREVDQLTSLHFLSLHELGERWWTRWYALLIALALVGYPIVAAGMQVLGAHDRAISIAFRGLTLSVALAILSVNGYARAELPKHAVWICWLLWLLLLSRFTWDATMVRLPLDLPWMDYVLLIVGTVIVPSAAAVRVCDLRALDLAARLIQLLALFAALLVVAAVLVVTRDFISTAGRIGTETLNPITIGHLGTTLVIVSVLAPERMEPGGFWARIADARATRWLCGFLGVILVIGAGSRGPALALIVAFVVRRLNRDIIRFGVLGVVKAGLIVVAVASTFLGIALLIFEDPSRLPLVSRVLGFAYDRALSVRAELAQGALQQFEGSPWLGSSFVELAQRIYPHNILVEILMTNGIVGFVLLAVLLVFVVKALLRLLQTPFAWLGLLCLQYLTASMSSGSLYFDATFWLLPMAVLGADWTNRHFGQSRSGGIAPR